MKTKAVIQKAWLRLLRQDLRAGEIGLEKLGSGYYAVVVADGQPSYLTDVPVHHQALKGRIPHIERTRAVYLQSAEKTYRLLGTPSLRSWAGDDAARVEDGARQAFAAVEVDVLAGQLAARLVAAGWGVEGAGEALRVTNERFAESVNLLRTAVRMVLWRSDATESARVAVREMRSRFAQDAFFYDRFEKRFAGFRPGVIDHFFVAYPVDCCAALGWDYWELAGRSAAEAEAVFGRGMQEVESFLNGTAAAWLTQLPMGSCGVNHFLK